MSGTSSRTAVVTGASTGIGRAIALALGRAGYDLAVTDLDAAWLNELVAKPELQGRRVVPIALELRARRASRMPSSRLHRPSEPSMYWSTMPDGPAAACRRRDRCGMGRRHRHQPQGQLLLSTAFARHCIAHKRGSEVVSGLDPRPHRHRRPRDLRHLKGGIIQMTRMLAIEWAPLGIRVNAIAPATVLTPSREKMLSDPEARARMLARIPLARFPTPDEVAAAVCYLASDAARSITGQVLALDGGLTAA
jgi:2-deoxy-D-gluconate 3-dehydrogenase